MLSAAEYALSAMWQGTAKAALACFTDSEHGVVICCTSWLMTVLLADDTLPATVCGSSAGLTVHQLRVPHLSDRWLNGWSAWRLSGTGRRVCCCTVLSLHDAAVTL